MLILRKGAFADIFSSLLTLKSLKTNEDLSLICVHVLYKAIYLCFFFFFFSFIFLPAYIGAKFRA